MGSRLWVTIVRGVLILIIGGCALHSAMKCPSVKCPPAMADDSLEEIQSGGRSSEDPNGFEGAINGRSVCQDIEYISDRISERRKAGDNTNYMSGVCFLHPDLRAQAARKMNEAYGRTH